MISRYCLILILIFPSVNINIHIIQLIHYYLRVIVFPLLVLVILKSWVLMMPFWIFTSKLTFSFDSGSVRKDLLIFLEKLLFSNSLCEITFLNRLLNYISSDNPLNFFRYLQYYASTMWLLWSCTKGVCWVVLSTERLLLLLYRINQYSAPSWIPVLSGFNGVLLTKL